MSLFFCYFVFLLCLSDLERDVFGKDFVYGGNDFDNLLYRVYAGVLAS